ncbi:MAG TPA: membrane protein insertase YidC [Rhizomicrobium sp.]|jgi:YidC/Oxa1 family membrane protein insertase
MSENRNLIVAFLLSALVIFGWEYFVAMPEMRAQQHKQALLTHQEKKTPELGTVSAPQGVAGAASEMTREAALKASGKRIVISTPKVDGSIRLTGATFDDLRLRDYHETVDKKSPEIVLLAPSSTKYPYLATFGWVGAPGSNIPLPDSKTVWTQTGDNTLGVHSPVTLTWDNGHGLVFTRTISVDDQYMFTIADSVQNKGAAGVSLYPYAAVTREGLPQSQHYWVLHEGFVGEADGSLHDPKYDDLKAEKPTETFHSTGGWAGITDKYWMAAVVPPQNEAFDGTFSAHDIAGKKTYQADYRLSARTIAPGATATATHKLFAGAKVVKTLQTYEKRDGIRNFDMAVDWGWFWFFTRPIFWLLEAVSNFLVNIGITTVTFGIAILVLTVFIRLALYPMANAGFKQMTRMKKLQPEMEKLKTRFGDDKVKQQQELMALYQREKVNPVSGCLPMVIQIPVMFSLYKVFLVTIEMYHAPFFGWIHDLSAPDPTSWVNLFGLLPFHPLALLPGFLAFLSIGAWPIILGFTQWVQTRMNPAPGDPATAQMFNYMPIMFTFMFAAFPAGLVIYYTWSNLLTMTQQYIMMRRHGVEIHLFNNLPFTRKKPTNT